jgi:hypothetical protein
MLTLEKLSRKAQEVSLESRQGFAQFLNRRKPELAGEDKAVIRDLKTIGVHVTSIENMFGEEAGKLLNILINVAKDLDVADDQELPDYLQKRTSSIDMQAETIIAKYPEVFFLSLSQRILNIVESYLGLPAAYHGVALRRSLIDGKEVGPRLWHKDGEDFHEVRVVIYLNDVELEGGPFEYIPRTYGLDYKDLSWCQGKYTDENIRKIVPDDVIRQVYGKAGTVIFCDTANTFHHEKLQVSKNRSVAMYGFSSRMPRSLALSKAHFPAESVKDKLTQMLSPSLIPYVFGWRG